MTFNKKSAAARLAEKNIPVIFLTGPTATGKTAVAIELSRRFNGEIISVDSMQIYRGMDIGTAKPSRQEQALARHHLIDIVDPDQDYNLARFIEDAGAACNDLVARGKLPIFAGGTGLYMRGFINGLFELDPALAPKLKAAREDLKADLTRVGREAMYARLTKVDPISAARIHPHDSFRVLRALEVCIAGGIPWSTHLAAARNQRRSGGNVLKIGLSCDREKLYRTIDTRVDYMLTHGFRAEVEALLAAGFSPRLKSMRSIGYQHMTAHIIDNIDLDTTRKTMARDTRRYAKRQMTWFGREDDMTWLPSADIATIIQRVTVFLEKYHARKRYN